jgi:hypothetical protein
MEVLRNAFGMIPECAELPEPTRTFVSASTLSYCIRGTLTKDVVQVEAAPSES